MRRARIRVTGELLIEAFDLPLGTKVITPEIEFVVEHQDLKESPDVLDAKPLYSQTQNGRIWFEGWGQE